jgi:hypothetical protein
MVMILMHDGAGGGGEGREEEEQCVAGSRKSVVF